VSNVKTEKIDGFTPFKITIEVHSPGLFWGLYKMGRYSGVVSDAVDKMTYLHAKEIHALEDTIVNIWKELDMMEKPSRELAEN
jgi:hypothetical protein